MAKKLTGLKVLCIDDVSVNLVVLTRTLKYLGVDYRIAESGQAGLDQLQAEEYDVAFIDIMMPHISGWQVIETIRRDARSATRNMTAIAITADTGIPPEKFLTHRFDSYLYKPCDTLSFQSIIQLLGKLHVQKFGGTS